VSKFNFFCEKTKFRNVFLLFIFSRNVKKTQSKRDSNFVWASGDVFIRRLMGQTANRLWSIKTSGGPVHPILHTVVTTTKKQLWQKIVETKNKLKRIVETEHFFSMKHSMMFFPDNNGICNESLTQPANLDLKERLNIDFFLSIKWELCP
jgi:hypothetical protein